MNGCGCKLCEWSASQNWDATLWLSPEELNAAMTNRESAGSKVMDATECVRRLDRIGADDPEKAHCEADDTILAYLEENGALEVAKAYRRLVERCSWWM